MKLFEIDQSAFINGFLSGRLANQKVRNLQVTFFNKRFSSPPHSALYMGHMIVLGKSVPAQVRLTHRLGHQSYELEVKVNSFVQYTERETVTLDDNMVHVLQDLVDAIDEKLEPCVRLRYGIRH